MSQPPQEIKIGSKVSGKVYKRSLFSVIYLLIPVGGLMAGFILNRAGGALAGTIISLICWPFLMLFRSMYGWVFLEDGRLVRTMFGAADIVIDPQEVTAFSFQHIVPTVRLLSFEAFAIEDSGHPRPSVHKASAWVKAGGWGSQRQEFFGKLTAWVKTTPVQTDEVTNSSLQKLQS